MAWEGPHRLLDVFAGAAWAAQLLAQALGAEVRPGPEPEIGWSPVHITEAEDPLLERFAALLATPWEIPRRVAFHVRE